MNLEVDENGRYPVLRTAGSEGRQLDPEIRKLVLRRDRYRCVFCGKDGLLEVDHIIPWSAGGSDDLDNLRTLCKSCNQDRSNFRVPADSCRRLPNSIECVYCTPDLIGETTTPVYCIQCNKKAPGVPWDPNWQQPEVQPQDYDETPLPRIDIPTVRPPLVVSHANTQEGGRMRSWAGTDVRVNALKVGCRYCHSAPGEACKAKGTGKPLEAFPAHVCRIGDANKANAAPPQPMGDAG